MMYFSRVFKASWWDRHLIVAGVGFGVVYWFVESLLHVFIFRDGEFVPQVFYPDAHEIWIRLVVAGLMIFFSVFAQKVITIRRRAEEALNEREKELSLILENNPAGIVLVDSATDRISWANSNALKLNHRERPYVRVRFRDRGTGIPRSVLGKVTKPFFSTKSDRTRTGLGLTISLDIVERHGGMLDIDSREGEYTRIDVDLPADNSTG